MRHIEFTEKTIRRPVRLLTLAEACEELDRLAQAGDVLISRESWDLPHVFDHCARSLDYIREGFPEMRSAFFRSTVGTAAYHVFDWRGQFSHNKTMEIPGSQPRAALDFETTLALLRQSIRAFLEYDGPLQPHFTFGKLTKAQAEKANAMHIADHLSLVKY
jgi:hypothetical protein